MVLLPARDVDGLGGQIGCCVGTEESRDSGGVFRLARAADPLSAGGPARAEVYVLALVVAVSGLLTALPVPIRW